MRGYRSYGSCPHSGATHSLPTGHNRGCSNRAVCEITQREHAAWATNAARSPAAWRRYPWLSSVSSLSWLPRGRHVVLAAATQLAPRAPPRIETLREIAEHPVAVTEPATPHPHYPTDHVLLLPEPSDRVGRDRRRSPSGRAAGSLRPIDADYSSRPTIARLPTIGPALHLESLQVGFPRRCRPPPSAKTPPTCARAWSWSPTRAERTQPATGPGTGGLGGLGSLARGAAA